MNVLVIDVGGTHVKILASGQTEKREFDSGPELTAQQMVSAVRRLAAGWPTTRCRSAIRGRSCTIGRSPNRTISGPAGWASISGAAFGRPVKLINDAAMQALGGYKKGRMLFLGLGTGLGSTLIADGSRGADGAWASALQEGDL